jgi:ESS family glutamate:Na+ symporter
MGITIIAAMVLNGFFSAAGILLPFGFGQGTGQAMNYGNIYETEYGFINGKSFGLTIAALGFISASFGGVIHLNVMRKLGKLKSTKKEDDCVTTMEDVESVGEIPMQESIDKLTVQVALIFVSYLLSYVLMYLLSLAVPGMKSTIWGFNFILGVLAASLVKWCMNLFKRLGGIKKEYTNNFLLTRTSNFFFDIMIVAGIAAIRLDSLKRYWGIMLILGVVGLIVTYIYNRFVAKTLFKEYAEEQFLAMYGMLTGTASTGVILLREVDSEFKTPASDNLVYQNFPAIALGFPMMLLATLAPQRPVLTLIIFVVFFAVLNVVLFRSKIFKSKK